MNFDRQQISNEFVPLLTLFLLKTIYAYMRTRVCNCKLSRLTVIRAIDVSIAKLHGNRMKMILLFRIYIILYIKYTSIYTYIELCADFSEDFSEDFPHL